jgi:hypothetical protein
VIYRTAVRARPTAGNLVLPAFSHHAVAKSSLYSGQRPFQGARNGQIPFRDLDTLRETARSSLSYEDAHTGTRRYQLSSNPATDIPGRAVTRILAINFLG